MGAEPAGQATLVLASASPRRLALLRQVGLDPIVRPADVDESLWPGESPADYVVRLARAKALAPDRAPDELVLAADTTVVCDGRALGKPRDAEEAAGMLARLAGGCHEVLTAVALVGPAGPSVPPDSVQLEQLVRTRVQMVALTPGRIAAYVATGEPMGKAGGFAIQGRAAAFVARIEGSYTGVVGLPLPEVLGLLARIGFPKGPPAAPWPTSPEWGLSPSPDVRYRDPG